MAASIATLTKLREAAEREASHVRRMKLGVEQERARIAEESGKHQSYRADKLAAMIAKKAPEFGAARLKLVDYERTAAAELLHWGSAAAVLGALKLDKGDPVADAQIRAARVIEYGAMDEATLKAHADELRRENRLAEYGIAFMVSRKFAKPLSLDGLTLPSQVSAIAQIRGVEAAHAQAVLDAMDALGERVSPVDRLTLGRTIAAGRPKAIKPAREVEKGTFVRSAQTP